MSEDDAAELQALQTRIAALAAGPPCLDHCEALAERAHHHVRRGAWVEAAADLRRAAEVAQAAGCFAERGRYLRTAGLLLARSEGQEDEARAALLEAAAQLHLVGDLPGEVQALEELARLHAATGDFAGAAAQIEVALEHLARWEHPERAALQTRLQQVRAALLLSHGRPDRALQSLEETLASLGEAADPRTRLALRLQQRALQRFTLTEGPPVSFRALCAEAEELGDGALAGDVRLAEAAELLQSGQLEEALAQAEGARRAALELPDPLRYLLACLLIAEARERLGDRPGVLAILLTCKVSLENFLGREAGQALVLVLDSLERRWGRQALQEARQRYREQFQAQVAARARSQDP